MVENSLKSTIQYQCIAKVIFFLCSKCKHVNHHMNIEMKAPTMLKILTYHSIESNNIVYYTYHENLKMKESKFLSL